MRKKKTMCAVPCRKRSSVSFAHSSYRDDAVATPFKFIVITYTGKKHLRSFNCGLQLRLVIPYRSSYAFVGHDFIVLSMLHGDVVGDDDDADDSWQHFTSIPISSEKIWLFRDNKQRGDCVTTIKCCSCVCLFVC